MRSGGDPRGAAARKNTAGQAFPTEASLYPAVFFGPFRRRRRNVRSPPERPTARTYTKNGLPKQPVFILLSSYNTMLKYLLFHL